MATVRSLPVVVLFIANLLRQPPKWSQADPQTGFILGRQPNNVEQVMSILIAENLGLSFGAFDLFKGITVTVPPNGKIGLIGPNGIGKTSLLLI